MSREKQIEEMAKTIVDSDNKEVADALSMLFVRLAEAIYNAGYRKRSEPYSCSHENGGEWISVEDRVPDGYGVFLVAVKVKLLWKTEWEYCVDMARFNVSKIPSVNGWDYESGDGYEYVITHWMPLPEAPKKGGGE